MSQAITPRWLTRKTAKQYCSLSIPTIDRRIRDKSFATKKVGRVRLIDRESLDAWIEGRRIEGSPESIAAQIAHHAREIQRLSAIISGR